MNKSLRLKGEITILRVNPENRAIATMSIRIGKDARPKVRKLCRAREVGDREIMRVDDMLLIVAGGLDVEEEMKGWRLKGGEDTAGISILYGRGPNGGMFDCPVDAKWLRDRIVWLDGEDIEGRDERAAAIIQTMNDEIRAAMEAAMPAPDGTMWLPVDHSDLFPAIAALGLTTESSAGQRLTPVGISVHDILTWKDEA